VTTHTDVPRDLDLGDTTLVSTLSNEACIDLVHLVADDTDYRITDWEVEFLESVYDHKGFSPKQKGVIYKLAFRLKLI
jgi:hypothetical protein